MIFPVLILFSTLLCHVAIAGRTCPKPDDLPFAVVVPLKTFYEPGEQIVYSCKPGYVSQGGMRRFTCPLTGMWPINTLKCTRRVCPFAGILENGIVRYTTFEYPNTINFTCNPGLWVGLAGNKYMLVLLLTNTVMMLRVVQEMEHYLERKRKSALQLLCSSLMPYLRRHSETSESD